MDSLSPWWIKQHSFGNISMELSTLCKFLFHIYSFTYELEYSVGSRIFDDLELDYSSRDEYSYAPTLFMAKDELYDHRLEPSLCEMSSS